MATPNDKRYTIQQSRLSHKQGQIVRNSAIYLFLLAMAGIFLMPLFWMLSTSLKPKSQWFSRELDWIPRTITTSNYELLLNNQQAPIGRWFINSTLIAVISTVVILIIDSMAAYAYARMEFRGRKFLFGLLLATLFLPGIMFVVPNFLTVYHLDLLDNYAGVIMPGLAGVFGVFFLRQFFESLPKDLEEAAYLDGATPFQTFFYVALPLAKPALATLGIITFMASWNDFLWPLLILRKRELQTLPPGLTTLQSAYTSEYGQMMAGAVITAVPVLVIYVLLQRYIVQSVASTGLKG